jgi:hypothetical protein
LRETLEIELDPRSSEVHSQAALRLEAVPGDDQAGKRADDAVTSRVDLADHFPVFARCLDDAAGTGVDDRSHAARLRIESILFRHVPHTLISGRELFVSAAWPPPTKHNGIDMLLHWWTKIGCARV